MSTEEQNDAVKVEGQLINLLIQNPKFLAKVLSNDKSLEILKSRSDLLRKVISSDVALNMISESKELLDDLLSKDRVFSSILANEGIRNGILSNDLLLSSLRNRTDVQVKILRELGFEGLSNEKRGLSTIDSASFYQSVFLHFWSALHSYFDLKYDLDERNRILHKIRNIDTFREAVKAALSYKDGVVGIFDCEVRVPDENSAITLFEEIYITQDYRFECNTQYPVIVDLGAHVGLSVIFFKDQYPDSKIIAVEASPANYKLLLDNLVSYGIDDVNLLNKAVADVTKEIEFYISLTDSMANTSTERRLNLNDSCEKISVEGITLDEICSDLEEIDFLKIDIEGSELDALKGGTQSLKKVKKMFIEYHGGAMKEGNELAQILAILDKNQFKYHIADAVSSSLRMPFANKSNEEAFSLKIFAVKKGE